MHEPRHSIRWWSHGNPSWGWSTSQLPWGWAATRSSFPAESPSAKGASRPWKVMLHLTLHSSQWLTHTVGNSSPFVERWDQLCGAGCVPESQQGLSLKPVSQPEGPISDPAPLLPYPRFSPVLLSTLSGKSTATGSQTLFLESSAWSLRSQE